MRLAAMVAAKEAVVQKNADAIKIFRSCLSYLGLNVGAT